MFGMGGTEILLVGIVALIVVGPKELPGLFRSFGQFVGKARGMAREFSRAMEDAADQSGMKEAGRTLKGLSNPSKYGMDKVKEAANPLKWDADSATGKLAEDRAEASKKIQEATARAAQKRLDAEAAAQANPLPVPELPQNRAQSTAGAPAPQAPVGQPVTQPAMRQTPGQRAAGAARKPATRVGTRGPGTNPRRPVPKG
ncbi:sec-independent protein translocase protein TatB [Pseudooceanicola antarcticus]|uniref:Sec-independent protein translocase protein TatB n=1 Tax=Pseudooceanicola antarcticus TaxID=1247613 RepID=A0A285J1U0_9RHOB|nr:Sec-independent protein translocase protein TatB [Pseudooceanicola antarcticus]PJE29808.1 twin-arginine translocase subunit TatB [Pseudooceanicola antarcticus]SNY54285.1 sec-independent protein translocase protein TatB [Pseudooceanicola antarcticus]